MRSERKKTEISKEIRIKAIIFVQDKPADQAKWHTDHTSRQEDIRQKYGKNHH